MIIEGRTREEEGSEESGFRGSNDGVEQCVEAKVGRVKRFGSGGVRDNRAG